MRQATFHSSLDLYHPFGPHRGCTLRLLDPCIPNLSPPKPKPSDRAPMTPLGVVWQGVPDLVMSSLQAQVHGWDRIKNVNCYSLLGLSTHKM